MKRGFAIIMGLVIVSSSLSVFMGTAEATPARVYIHVEDANGAPISNANVTMTNMVRQLSLYASTDQNGDCTITPGIYEPGGLVGIGGFGETIRVTATKNEYSGYSEFVFPVSSGMVTQWVNVTMVEPDVGFSFPPLVMIGVGLCLIILIVAILILSRRKDEENSPTEKKGQSRDNIRRRR